MVIKNVRAVYFPYCIEKQEDGSWALLRRNYKPVGFNTNEFIKYGEHPMSTKLRGIGAATLRKLLYNDVPSPEWHREVLSARAGRVKSGEAKFKDFESVKSELRSEFK